MRDVADDEEPVPDELTAGAVVPAPASPPPASPPLEKRVAFEAVGRRLFGRGSTPVTFGRFAMLGTIGRGGMGTVFKAYDESLDRAVAIKLLRSGTSERQAERLRREAQALAKLSHPNVVHVYEVGRANEQWFIAMELVSGQTLRQWHEGDHGWRECVRMYLQAGAGLAAAHAAGLVHRDFKPDNCIIDEQGRPRVLDFGLVRDATRTSESAPSTATLRSSEVEASLTGTGAMLGTLGYMPLEQLEGKPADARSDQFSFCVSLYEALYGERPFAGGSATELTAAMKGAEVRPAPRGTVVPSAVRRALLRGLVVDPSQRWPTMEALLAELRRQVAPRSGRWLGLGLASGLTAVGVGVALYAQVGFRCEGAAARLRGVWDEERSPAVKDAILGTGLSYAPDTWERVEERLDGYADAWASKHTEVCEATTVRQEQSSEVMDLRMECLRQRHVALREAVDVLVEANESRVKNAVELVAGLPGLSRCDDVEALAAELPPPEDPDVAEAVNAQRDRLRRAALLERAGDYDDALAVVDEVAVQAETLGYTPLRAEAWFSRGQLLFHKGHYAESERYLEHAYLLATEHEHGEVEARAAATLARVVGERRDLGERGLWWGRTALALAKRSSVGPEIRHRALNDISTMLLARDEHEDALTYFQEALALAEQLPGPASPGMISSMDGIGNVLSRQGKYDDALMYHQRALALSEEIFGPGHPTRGNAFNHIGNVLLKQGRLEDALSHYRRALAVWEEALGVEHPFVGVAHNGIGTTLAMQGKHDEALVHMKHALANSEKLYEPTHRAVLSALNNVGATLYEQRKFEEALPYLRRVVAMREKTLGPRHARLADSLLNLGLVLVEQDEPEEALSYIRRSLAIVEETLGPEHPQLAYAHIGAARAALGLHDREDAKAHYQRALAVLEATVGSDHRDTAYPHAGLARIALEQREPDVARTHAERAVSVCEASECLPEATAWSRFMLAQVSWSDPSQRVRARELAQQARETYAGLGEAVTDEVTEIDTWLAAHPVP